MNKCVSLNYLHQIMTFHMYCIFEIFDLHEEYLCLFKTCSIQNDFSHDVHF